MREYPAGDEDEKTKLAKAAAREALKKIDRVYVNGVYAKINYDSRHEFVGSEYTNSLRKNSKNKFADKMRMADVIDDIVAATVAWKNDGGLKHPRKDDFVDFVKGNVLIDSGNAKYSASVVIGVNKHGEYTLYDITNITKEDFSYKKADVPPDFMRNKPRESVLGKSTDITIARPDDSVKHSMRETEQKYQPRDEQISVRELLANVIEDASTSADEMAWLKGYRKDLNELDKKLDAIGQNKQIIRELMFKKGRTSEESQRLSKARGQLIVSGHSRKYFGQAFEGRFWLNHGNLGKRRFAQKTSFALLRIDGGTWNVEKIVPKQQRKKHRWTAPG